MCVCWTEESEVHLQADSLPLAQSWHRGQLSTAACLVSLLPLHWGNRTGTKRVIPERCARYEEASSSGEENWAESLCGSRMGLNSLRWRITRACKSGSYKSAR